MELNDVVVLDALRTPIGKYRGGLARVRPDDMAAHVLRSLLARQPAAKDAVEEVICGATNQAGEDNRNIARMALLLAGLPDEVTGVTVNRLCGSGLEAVIQAARAIALGDHEVVVAGGVESMTRAPWSMPKPEGAYAKPPKVYDTSLGWRFQNPKMEERFPLVGMGVTAENVAEKYGVSREDQDAFALECHRKAMAAWEAGRFADEVVPVTVPPAHKRDTEKVVERDECIRPDTSLEKLAKLPTVFKKDGGTVTPGNASPLNDGAAMVLLASRKWAEKHGVTPLARFVSSGVAGVHPNYMGIGPIPSTRKALAKAGLEVGDIDLVELNEAFAAQSLACVRELGLDPEKVNVNGGAIALGHPIGCSGARIVGTLLNAMKQREAKRGLATLCIGVGQGLAAVFERVS